MQENGIFPVEETLFVPNNFGFQDLGLLNCDALSLTSQRFNRWCFILYNLNSPSRRHQVTSKLRESFTKRQNITSQKTWIFCNNAFEELKCQNFGFLKTTTEPLHYAFFFKVTEIIQERYFLKIVRRLCLCPLSRRLWSRLWSGLQAARCNLVHLHHVGTFTLHTLLKRE
jgi:hypothetical protein